MLVPALATAVLLASTAFAREVDPARALADRLYRRLGATPLAESDPRLERAADLIGKGRAREAAQEATREDGFYDAVLRDFSAPLSGRSESVGEPLNDIQLMVIGVARDDLDARTLLFGNFTYQGRRDLNLPAAPAHFQALEQLGVPLAKNIVRLEPAQGTGVDAAGVFTTHAWAASHFTAGTNRRPVEFAFRAFLCAPISEWKDGGALDDRVRRDVDRRPGGNPSVYSGVCRQCHGVLDGLAGAFARWDVFAGSTFPRYFLPPALAPKMNQNAQTYPDGYRTFDDSWVNYATDNHNRRFGWKGALRGKGVAAFGRMLAESDAFGRCFAKRAFKVVCPQVTPLESSIEKVAKHFRDAGHRLRELFVEAALSPECLGAGKDVHAPL